MGSKYIPKNYTFTEESLQELREIAESIGEANLSAAIRYCIKQVYKQLQKEAV